MKGADRTMNRVELNGVYVFSRLLEHSEQVALVEDIRTVVRQAPLFWPVTPRGQKMSVRMTSVGRFGWISDQGGYRYAPLHPDGQAWPEIPENVLAIWRKVSESARDTECCLVNFYDAQARMGLHQDRDEVDFTQPVVSISLGDDALFRVGGTERGGKTRSIWLRSGDVAVIGGEARLAFHGVDRLRPASSTLLPKGGRINLTLRVVT